MSRKDLSDAPHTAAELVDAARASDPIRDAADTGRAVAEARRRLQAVVDVARTAPGKEEREAQFATLTTEESLRIMGEAWQAQPAAITTFFFELPRHGYTKADVDRLLKAIKGAVPTRTPTPSRLHWCEPNRRLESPPDWTVDNGGVWSADGENVCRLPLVIVATVTDIERADRRLWTLAWREKGQWSQVTLERGVAQDARRLTAYADHGLPVNSSNAGRIVTFLADFEAYNVGRLQEGLCATRTGWHGDTFVYPGHPEVELWPTSDGEAQAHSVLRAKGDASLWRQVVEDAAQHPPVGAAVLAAAAPIVGKLLSVKGGCLELAANTTTGKTTAMQVAVSVVGDPSTDDGIPIEWKETDTYIIERARACADMPVFVDDTKKRDERQRKTISTVVYALSGGRGKGRAQKDGGLRVSSTTRCWLLSTGEAPLWSFGRDEGLRLRVLTITESPFDGDCTELIDRIDDVLAENYGHGLRPLVAWLEGNKPRWAELREWYAEAISWWRLRAETQQAKRLAKLVAVLDVTQQVLVEADVLTVPREALEAAWRGAEVSAGQADQAAAAMRDVAAITASKRDHFWGQHVSRGQQMEPVVPHSGWLGAWPRDRPDWVAWMPDRLRTELERLGYEPNAVIRQWAERGWLLRSSNRLDPKTTVAGARPRCHRLTLAALDLGGDHDD